MRNAALVLSFILALPAAAAEPGLPMTAAEFDAATVGRTLYYNSGGLSYGVEQYLPGRKVIWTFLGDYCREGECYEDGGYICFVYEDNPEPQCWTFYQSSRGIVARFEDDPTLTTLYEITKTPELMMCLGPEVGT